MLGMIHFVSFPGDLSSTLADTGTIYMDLKISDRAVNIGSNEFFELLWEERIFPFPFFITFFTQADAVRNRAALSWNFVRRLSGEAITVIILEL